MLSKRQKNALRILKDRLDTAKANYLMAFDSYIRLYNNEPDKKSFDKWSLWRARLKLAREDMLKCFSKYNLAINHYDNYRKVALGL